MTSRSTSGAGVAAALAMATALSLAACDEPAQDQAAQPGGATLPAVGVSEARTAPVTPAVTFTGRVEAIDKVDLRARVSGFLEERRFEEGSAVQKGAALFVIEKPPFEATVQEAQAAVARAKANLDLAQVNQRRAEDLVRRKAVAQQQLDNANAALAQARADLLAQQAALEQAQINLGYTDIVAPITGKIGRSTYSRRQLRGPVERHPRHHRQHRSDLCHLPGQRP